MEKCNQAIIRLGQDNPQSTHKALNFINNKYVQQLQKERDVGVKLTL